MKKKYIVLLLITFLIIPLVSYAHQGNTDASGGHNSSTGYHYHHGYPAHQHENGQCPYDFNDKTGLNSGSSTNSNDNNNNYVVPAETPQNPISVFIQYMLMFAMYGLIIWAFIMVIIIAIKKEPEKKPVYTTTQYKPQKNTDNFNTKSDALITKNDALITNEVKINPTTCYAEPIGAKPQQKPECKKTVFVYVTKSGNKYHKKNCKVLTGGERRMDVSIAKGLGYTPCSKCDPPK